MLKVTQADTLEEEMILLLYVDIVSAGPALGLI